MILHVNITFQLTYNSKNIVEFLVTQTSEKAFLLIFVECYVIITDLFNKMYLNFPYQVRTTHL